MKNKAFTVLCLLILVILTYFSLFHNLGFFQIRMWDEATYVNNALDMFWGKKILVVHHLDVPDMYNTKPPFAIWMQSISMFFFGLNEFGVRFPSAFFSLLTVISLFYFSVKVLKSKLIAIVSVLVLISSQGFIMGHVARTADLDGILTFWITFYYLIFLRIVMKPMSNPTLYFLLLSIGIVLSFFTKSIAGFFFLPFLIIITFLDKNYKIIFKNNQIFVFIIAVLVVCFSYFIYRESVTPGYLDLIFRGEVKRIYDNVANWLVQPFNYYLIGFKEWRYQIYLYILPLTLITLFLSNSNNIKKTFKYNTILIVGYLVLISYPPVKQPWYDAPLYPVFALQIGIFMDTLINKINSIESRFSFYLKAFVAVTFITLFSVSYYKTLKNHFNKKENIWEMELDGALLKKVSGKYPDIITLKILKEVKNIEHLDQVLFYKRILEHENFYKIEILTDTVYNKGDYILTYQKKFQDIIEKKYSYTIIDSVQTAKFYSIN